MPKELSKELPLWSRDHPQTLKKAMEIAADPKSAISDSLHKFGGLHRLRDVMAVEEARRALLRAIPVRSERTYSIEDLIFKYYALTGDRYRKLPNQSVKEEHG